MPMPVMQIRIVRMLVAQRPRAGASATVRFFASVLSELHADGDGARRGNDRCSCSRGWMGMVTCDVPLRQMQPEAGSPSAHPAQGAFCVESGSPRRTMAMNGADERSQREVGARAGRPRDGAARARTVPG